MHHWLIAVVMGIQLAVNFELWTRLNDESEYSGGLAQALYAHLDEHDAGSAGGLHIPKDGELLIVKR